MFLVNGTVEPSGSVTVPAIKSRKTAPDSMPIISVPAGFVPLIPVVNNEPIIYTPN
jgi:hypothetical protein